MSKESEFIDKYNFGGKLATVDENGRPRVRGFALMKQEDKRLVFATSNKKDVFRQLKTNPYAEWIVSSDEHSTLRISGDVVFDDDHAVKEDVLYLNPVVRKMYTGREDEFEVFYLENLEYKWFHLKPQG